VSKIREIEMAAELKGAGRTVGGVNVDGGDGWRDEEEEEAAERVGGGEDQKRPPEGHGVGGLGVRRRRIRKGDFCLWNSNKNQQISQKTLDD
jgi:hypothetical protein